MNPFPSELEKGSRAPDYPSSAQAPSYAPFCTTFASISLHRSDRLRTIGFSDPDLSSIRSVISSSWRKGIQEERKYSMSHEFKLNGRPWYGQGDDAITSRVLIRGLLAYLFSIGWILHASTDVSKDIYDKDTIFFRKQQQPPPESNWIAITFNMSDRLRLIGADAQLIASVKGMLGELRLLQKEMGWKDQANGAWEWKINGYPWHASGEATMVTRYLLLKFLEVLEANGWSLYANIDHSEGTKDVGETDSWYCVRDKTWIPGMAVYHR